MEKFCDLFTFDLIATLTYVLIDNFCPCLDYVNSRCVSYNIDTENAEVINIYFIVRFVLALDFDTC